MAKTTKTAATGTVSKAAKTPATKTPGDKPTSDFQTANLGADNTNLGEGDPNNPNEGPSNAPQNPPQNPPQTNEGAKEVKLPAGKLKALGKSLDALKEDGSVYIASSDDQDFQNAFSADSRFKGKSIFFHYEGPKAKVKLR